MREDQHRFLALPGQLPFRLTAEQAAWVLNCQTHDTRDISRAACGKTEEGRFWRGKCWFRFDDERSKAAAS
jgi:hypothetical protein